MCLMSFSILITYWLDNVWIILGRSYMLISSGSYIIIISQSSLWFIFHPFKF